MKGIIAIFSIFILITACSCTADLTNPEPLPDGEYKLQYGQTITLKNSGIDVQFSELLGDSRCPTGVECVWAGNAKIQILFDKIPIKLNTNSRIGNGNKATVSGYRVKLISLSPYPEVNKQVKQRNYVATFLITKTGK